MSQPGLYGATGNGASFQNLDYATPKGGGVNFHAQSVGFMLTPPFLIFAFMDLTWAFLSGTYFLLCLVLSALCVAFSVLFFMISRGHQRGPIYLFVSILSFLATWFGISAGQSVQARFYGNYWNYKNRPVYTDVLATDPAAARADGGIINFESHAIVDTFRSGHILNSKGHHFCVAPILDESQQSRAEFWAVGMDCCTGRVGFYCDDAQDVTAKTGAVVFDLDTIMSADPYSKYIDAVKQAAARNQIQIPKNPILVRWVKDANEVTDGLWREGSIHLVVGLLFYALASVVAAVALHAATSR